MPQLHQSSQDFRRFVFHLGERAARTRLDFKKRELEWIEPPYTQQDFQHAKKVNQRHQRGDYRHTIQEAQASLNLAEFIIRQAAMVRNNDNPYIPPLLRMNEQQVIGWSVSGQWAE